MRAGARRVAALLTALHLAACGGGGGAGGVAGVPALTDPLAPAPFRGNIVLGAPAASTIKASILSADQSGTVWISYGTSPGAHDRQTAAVSLAAGAPLELALDGLGANTRYFYRLLYRPTGATTAAQTDEFTFQTALPAGATFTFTIQSDSHLDENSDLDLYRRTLANVRADAPDFHVDLGDTFMCEKHSEPLTALVQPASSQATVDARYAYERAHFGLATHSSPLFLVNGNHDGELGWLADATAENLAVWTTRARLRYFPVPLPDAFYRGDGLEEPFVGRRASWYAWQWGDALFVVLDPFWNTKAKGNDDGWAYTLGERQYRWLQETLASSPATFKFVFIHNLVGGLAGQMRGGVEAAPYFEWGGRNADGTAGFAERRPGWILPVHALLVKHGVSVVFHGHDHLYARQALDGVAYQAVPQPSAKNSSSGAALAAEGRYASGTILGSSGHLRVTVGPDRVTVRYVRAWLPKDETGGRVNAQVDDAWSIAAP